MRNRTIGSLLIVAGTTIGAGMLAMPLAAAGVGFPITMILLIALWLLMSYTALLLVEVYQYNPCNMGLGSVAKRYLGRFGQLLTGFSLLLLMYALLTAYINGAGVLISDSLSEWWGISFSVPWSTLLFAVIGGLVVCIGTHSVDFINRLLFSAKIVFLVMMLFVMLPHVEAINLMAMPIEQGLILSSIPVIFTSFGFHGSVPSLVNYLEGDVKKLRFVFIAGSAIPLTAYVLWQVATLGTIPSDTISDLSNLDSLLASIRNVISAPSVNIAVTLFMDLALTTSFLGVALGLFDYLADLFKRSNNGLGRLQTGLLTFLPPLFCALYFTSFIQALRYAAVALSILALIIPALMVIQVRKTETGDRYRVKGGMIALIGTLFCGIAIILIQFAIVFDVLPDVG